MKQVFTKLPVYTGDVSGVCSALYELGGMVVMHDPSGCNSTYNTHDEIRWYDRDSLIFLSGLNEMDAILGSDEKLIRDTVEAAKIYSPAFIAIANSPIPYITGMDFDAVCRLIEQETGIPSFYISTNGMHDYTRGAGLALLHLAERFVKKRPAQVPVPEHKTGQPLSCNILGMTPLDFAAPENYRSLHEKIREAGMEIVSCWAMGDPEAQDSERRDPKKAVPHESGKFHSEQAVLETDPGEEAEGSKPQGTALLRIIENSASADVNLVVSSVGLPAADYLYKTFGIPCVAGIPARGVEKEYFSAVREAVRTGRNQLPFREREAFSEHSLNTGSAPFPESIQKAKPAGLPDPDKTMQCAVFSGPVCLIGEPVIMTSLAASIQKEYGCQTHVYGATEGAERFLGGQDAALCGEQELEEALRAVVRQAAVGPTAAGQTAIGQTAIGQTAIGQTADEQTSVGQKGVVQKAVSQKAVGPGEGTLPEDAGNRVRVVADPYYQKILPPGCQLVRLPHLAFSGRIFLREIPDLMEFDPA